MFFLLIPVFLIYIILKIFKSKGKRVSLKGKHVVITGGSSGIGKALGILAAKEGAHVTILARDIEKLEKAKNEIKSHIVDEEQLIMRVSVDIANYEDTENNLHELEEIVGPIFMLVNCAGMAICARLEDYTEQDIKSLVDVNFLGSLNAIKAILPKFKKRHEGIFVLTASQVALMGMYGMSVYSACKFALRGLAESLCMEVKPYNISVTLALPPDTDTPGFENENKTKLEETKLICQAGGLVKPEDVAKKMLDDALRGKFFSIIGFESHILTTLCVGMSPFQSFVEILFQSMALGPLRLISAFYLISFDNIIKKCYLLREKQKSD